MVCAWGGPEAPEPVPGGWLVGGEPAFRRALAAALTAMAAEGAPAGIRLREGEPLPPVPVPPGWRLEGDTLVGPWRYRRP